MKLITLVAILFCPQFLEAKCPEKSSVQHSFSNFKEADDELNRVYKAIIKEYKGKKQFITKLRDSQRLWVNLRDANVDMQFPHDDVSRYGSVYRDCIGILKMDYTAERIKFLNSWLEGVPEGESCAGSIKFK